jgi:hypothetical protein
LVHSFAKLITKILANRLAPELDKMVITDQSAFIQDRCIYDNFIMVNQTNKMLHKKRIPALFLKLDIKKAFDSVCWAFLLEILQHLGFGQVWCNLILNLLMTSSTQILVDGVPGQPISHKIRLRQGDPLSPLLSILVMDVLNSLFTKADECGLLHPLAGRNISQRVSMFIDDVAVFVKPVSEDLEVVREILRGFGVASGLQTNLQKSFSYPIWCDNERVELAVQTLGCASKNFSTTYPGLSLRSKKT